MSTNSYASSKFITKRKTIILIKNENYYEPIGLYHIDQKEKENFSFSSIFIDGNTTITGTKNNVLVNHVMQKCVNYENNPKHYKLSKNID